MDTSTEPQAPAPEDERPVTDEERREFCGYIEYVRHVGSSIFAVRMMERWNALPRDEQEHWIAVAASKYVGQDA